MTKGDQLLAVALIDGWKFAERVTDKKSGQSWDVYERGGERGSFFLGTMPDYMNDLNVTHRVAMKAGETIIKAMRFYLWEIAGQMRAHEATAEQRVEAIVRASDRWID